MAAYYPSPSFPEVEVTISSARDLKNVNWRHGALKPYVVLWVDPKAKCSTNVDEIGDTCPNWNETLVIPLTAPIKDSTLSIDIVQANAEEDTKPLIGSARVPLSEIVDDVGLGGRAHRTLQLKRPSGRPQGKVEVEIVVREPRYRAPDPYVAPAYGVPPPAGSSRDYPTGYAYGAPPGGYPYNPQGYGYAGGPQQVAVGSGKQGGSKFGVGTGLAVGAVAGVLGGLAIAEGVDYVEEKIEDDVVERVENDLAYDDGGYDDGYGGDDY